MPRTKQEATDVAEAKKSNVIKAPSDSIIVELMWDGKKEQLNLDEPAPEKFWRMHPYRKEMYIPIELVREVMRITGMRVTKHQTSYVPGAKSTIVDTVVEVATFPDEALYVGHAASVIGMKSFATTGFGAPGRVDGVAIKDALKKRYRFFEGNFKGAMMDIEALDFLGEGIDEILGEDKVEEEVPDEEVKTTKKKTTTKKEEAPAEEGKPLTVEDIKKIYEKEMTGYLKQNGKKSPEKADYPIVAGIVNRAIDPNYDDEKKRDESLKKMLMEVVIGLMNA